MLKRKMMLLATTLVASSLLAGCFGGESGGKGNGKDKMIDFALGLTNEAMDIGDSRVICVTEFFFS